MDKNIQSLLNYQKVDEELFKAERDFSKNADNVTYVKAVKKVQAMADTLAEYEKKAQHLLKKYSDLIAQKDSYVEEKIQLDKTIEDTKDLVAVEYIKGQIGILSSKLDALKTSIEELEKDMQAINAEYLSYAKEIKEAKEFGKSYKETFNKLSKDLKQKREEVAEELKKLEAGISAEFLERYKSKRADKKVVLPLVRGCDGKHCSHCFQEISMSEQGKLKKGELIECENCHKFIYQE